MADITTLIKQAMDNGDTATALTLARTLEHQTKISTVPVQQEEYYIPQQQYLPPQQVYTQQPQYLDVSYEPVEYYEPLVQYNPTKLEKITQFLPRNTSTWICLVILPYLAIAEVLAPGHQGPLKIHQTKLAWPIEMVGGMFPKGEVADAQSE
jgi:hypothetical protein